MPHDSFQAEPTTWSWGLIGFYIACTVVGIGAAAAAIVLVVFPQEPFALPVGILSAVLVVAGGIASWRLLRAARHE